MLHLKDYCMSKERGFLPEIENLCRLPIYYEPLEVLLDKLPFVVQNKSIREEVYKLPELSTKELKSEQHWKRAYLVLTFLSQAYLRGTEGLPLVLPRALAVPWYRVAQHLNLPNVVTYSSNVLFNFQLKDSSKGLEEDNIRILHTFTGTTDEEWFYKGFVLVEMAAVPGLNAIIAGNDAMLNGNQMELLECLKCLATSINSTTTVLDKIGNNCKPEVFYKQMRHFYSGTRVEDGFHNSLFYEGVGAIKGHAGTSAAQSSVLSAFDLFLGVKHKDEFFEEQQQYRPQSHRQFLEHLSQQPSLRAQIMKSCDCKLTLNYNQCIYALAEFRTRHLILVTRYIVVPSKSFMRRHSVSNVFQPLKGTAGTSLSTFLKAARDETLKHIISLE